MKNSLIRLKHNTTTVSLSLGLWTCCCPVSQLLRAQKSLNSSVWMKVSIFPSVSSSVLLSSPLWWTCSFHGDKLEHRMGPPVLISSWKFNRAHSFFFIPLREQRTCYVLFLDLGDQIFQCFSLTRHGHSVPTVCLLKISQISFIMTSSCSGVSYIFVSNEVPD